MNIGVDIDNVLNEFDTVLLKAFKKDDKNKRNTGIINKHPDHLSKGMFDWSKNEVDEFFANNMERIAENLPVKKGAKKYINKLLKKGHKIYLITHRVFPHYINPEKTTTEWLNKHKFQFTKLIFSEHYTKIDECKKYKIDIMIDDRNSAILAMREAGIHCLHMQTKYNTNTCNTKMYKTWKQIYKEIQKKINLILIKNFQKK